MKIRTIIDGLVCVLSILGMTTGYFNQEVYSILFFGFMYLGARISFEKGIGDK